MTSFTAYKFTEKDIVTKDVSSSRNQKKTADINFPVLPHEVESSVKDTVQAENKVFHVHPIVSDQLGLVTKEKEKVEQSIQREIDRRWVEVKEKAEVEGYTKGLKEGKLEAYNAEKPRIEEKLKKMESLLLAFEGCKKKIFSDNSDFLFQLLSQILRLIVLKEVELDKNYLERLVINLIDQISNKDDLQITISDSDANNISQLKESIGQKFGELKNLRIQSMSDIQPGSCRVETHTVVVDAQLENQIKNAMKVLSEDTKV